MAIAPPVTNPMDNAFWSNTAADREAALARLRAAAAPAFFTLPVIPEGFYLLAKHADVMEASRRPEIFGSEPAATTMEDSPVPVRESTPSMINLDDPRHARLRRIVSRSFTPRMIKRFEEDVAAIARRIVDDLLERGPCDFVTEVAQPMPLEIICAMMGVPAYRYAEVVEATDVILAMTDPGQRVPAERIKESVIFFSELMRELSEERRKEPGDDLITALVHADVDGESLSELELGAFFRLLVVAGNETTRNGLSHALILLTEHPAQRDLLLADLESRLPSAVEEIVRYASPVTWMRRTVKTDHELNGHRFQAGDTVVLHYASANRDEAVFDRPQDFDITRSPNPHVGFGGPGPHFCLGAHLARREITLLLRELFTRAPSIHAVGEPDSGPNGLINAVRHLRCAF